MGDMKKKCCKCKKEKAAKEFYKNSSSCDGLSYECKSCCYLYAKKYRKKNKSKINKYMRERRKRIAIENPKPIGEFDVVESVDFNGKTVKNKKCTQCKAIKNISNFGNDPNAKSGIKAACKDCLSHQQGIRQFIKKNEFKKQNAFYYCNANIYTINDVMEITGKSRNGIVQPAEKGDFPMPIQPILSNGSKGVQYWRKDIIDNHLISERRKQFFTKYPALKKCTGCGKTKPYDRFHKKFERLTPKCKKCHKGYNKTVRRTAKRIKRDIQWREENRDKIAMQERKRILTLTDGYCLEKMRSMRGVDVRGLEIPSVLIQLKRIQLKLRREIYK